MVLWGHMLCLYRKCEPGWQIITATLGNPSKKSTSTLGTRLRMHYNFFKKLGPPCPLQPTFLPSDLIASYLIGTACSDQAIFLLITLTDLLTM